MLTNDINNIQPQRNSLDYNISHNGLDNTLPSWLLPCSCFLPKCTCLIVLRPYILCIEGKSLSDTSSFLHPPTLLSISLNLLIVTLDFRKPLLPVHMTNMTSLSHTSDNLASKPSHLWSLLLEFKEKYTTPPSINSKILTSQLQKLNHSCKSFH